MWAWSEFYLTSKRHHLKKNRLDYQQLIRKRACAGSPTSRDRQKLSVKIEIRVDFYYNSLFEWILKDTFTERRFVMNTTSETRILDLYLYARPRPFHMEVPRGGGGGGIDDVTANDTSRTLVLTCYAWDSRDYTFKIRSNMINVIIVLGLVLTFILRNYRVLACTWELCQSGGVSNESGEENG